VPALEQHGGGALRHGPGDLLQHLLHRERPRLGVAGLAVEGAELAVGDADVGVVGVGVHNEGDAPLRELLEANLGGQRAQLEQRGFGEEPAPLVAGEPLAGQRPVADRLQHR